MRIACTEDKDGRFEAVTFFPVLQGQPSVLELRAAFSADDGVCGCISAALPGSKEAFDFFVPSFGAVRSLLVPGMALGLPVSGLAFSVETLMCEPQRVTCGPRYEKALDAFLAQPIRVPRRPASWRRAWNWRSCSSRFRPQGQRGAT